MKTSIERILQAAPVKQAEPQVRTASVDSSDPPVHAIGKHAFIPPFLPRAKACTRSSALP
jgi:hypothetical protein